MAKRKKAEGAVTKRKVRGSWVSRTGEKLAKTVAFLGKVAAALEATVNAQAKAQFTAAAEELDGCTKIVAGLPADFAPVLKAGGRPAKFKVGMKVQFKTDSSTRGPALFASPEDVAKPAVIERIAGVMAEVKVASGKLLQVHLKTLQEVAEK